MTNDTWKPSDGLRTATNDVIQMLYSVHDGVDSKELKWRFDAACENLDGNIALMRDENRRLRSALKAYRTALSYTGAETDALRQQADEALQEINTWEEWEG